MKSNIFSPDSAPPRHTQVMRCYQTPSSVSKTHRRDWVLSEPIRSLQDTPRRGGVLSDLITRLRDITEERACPQTSPCIPRKLFKRKSTSDPASTFKRVREEDQKFRRFMCRYARSRRRRILLKELSSTLTHTDSSWPSGCKGGSQEPSTHTDFFFSSWKYLLILKNLSSIKVMLPFPMKGVANNIYNMFLKINVEVRFSFFFIIADLELGICHDVQFYLTGTN